MKSNILKVDDFVALKFKIKGREHTHTQLVPAVDDVAFFLVC